MIARQHDVVIVSTAFVTPVAIRSTQPVGLRSDPREIHHPKQLPLPPPFHTSRAPVLPLYMGGTSILDRLSRVVKSNVNKWVSNIENPEKVINQSVNDLQVRPLTDALPRDLAVLYFLFLTLLLPSFVLLKPL